MNGGEFNSPQKGVIMDGTILGKKYDLMGSGGGGGGASSADKVSYDNTTSQLTADNVQEAIDEVVGELSDVSSDISDIATVVGDTDGGLVKDVADLGTDVSGLSSDVTDLQNANKYLTTETLVGKWGNANLYRKVVNVAELPNTTSVEVTLGISGYTLRRLEAYYGGASEAGNLFVYLTDMFYNVSTDKLTLQTNTDMSDFAGTIVVEYTK